MICPNCGREIPEGTVCPCATGSSQLLSSNPALNAIKTISSSKGFLVAVIFYTVNVVLNFVVQLTGNLSAEALSKITGVEFLYEANITGPMIFGAVLSVVPTALIALGMWLHYATCRRTDTGNISTAGLTICKVISIITLVTTCISAVITIIVLAVVAFAADGVAYYLLNTFWYMFDTVYSIDDFAAGLTLVAIILVVVCALVFAFVIYYYAAIVKTINRIRNTALTGVPDNRISQFVIAINYIFAVIGIIGGVFLVFGSPLVGVIAILSAVSQILISRCLSHYRKQATILMYPPVQPVYAQPAGYVQQPAAPAAPTAPEENNEQQ